MRLLIFICSLLCTMGISAQGDTINLTNPSFEDTPRAGGNRIYGIKGWYDCGLINFPDETPPDIHPQDFWENTKQASDGKTYLGMVVRDNDSWESVSQRLKQPLMAGECYTFSLELSQSKRYLSASRLNGPNSKPVNYTTPIVLRIWGGSGYCNTKELLGESAPVNHSEWKTYSFKFQPTFNHRYVTFEAFYKVPVLFPYNGHILVDNCAALIRVDCNEDLLATNDEKPKKKLPPHKRNKKETINKKKSKEVVSQEATVVTKPKKKKKILNLDRNKIKKGQIIEIQKLFFEADASMISEASTEVLEEIYNFLEENQDIIIEIGGHTNGQPTHDYCDKLSASRAKSVAKYMVDLGIDPDRLTYKGYGKRKPIASNKTDIGRKRNQRVEIKILSIDS